MNLWPWRKAPPPDPAEVARQAVRAELAPVLEEFQRALFPQMQSPPPVPIYQPGQKGRFPVFALDKPYWWSFPQSPNRRPDSLVNADLLRQLADLCDPVRACINHLRREVSAVEIQIVPRDPKDKTEATQARCADAMQYFSMAGGLGGIGRTRTQFEFQIIEDLCVLGACAVYYQGTRGGGVHQVLAIDSATIRPVVDGYGWHVEDGAAYEQWIQGIRVGNFTREELYFGGVYATTYSPYPKSPLEFLLLLAQTSMKADEWNRSWLTDGTTPGDMLSLGGDMSSDQFQTYVKWFYENYAGNTRERQQLKFLPQDSKRIDQGTRKDQDFEQLGLDLLRRICAIYGVQPASIGYAGEIYKVAQEQSMASTTEFGVGVLLDFRKSLYDDLLGRQENADLECQNVSGVEESQSDRADRLAKLVAGAVLTPNEARAEEGKDPLAGGETLFVATTLQPLELALKPPEPPAPAGGQPGDGTATQRAEAAPADSERAEALDRWERDSLRRLESEGRADCWSRAQVLPIELRRDVERGLKGCRDAEGVRSFFCTYRDASGGEAPEMKD